jgi:hypothetical protein
MWFLGSFIGSISLVILNALSKLLPLCFSNVLILGLLSLFTTGCFVYAWQTSPQQFLVVWFLQSGLVSAGAFFVYHYWVKDTINYQQVLGVLSILGGGLLLIKWS